MSTIRHARPAIAVSRLAGPSRRTSTPSKSRCLTGDSSRDVSNQLREVMRNVPQPVAVAVTRVPTSPGQPPPQSRYHGTTLSSFTSLTLHPLPLVAFSVRLPSRMADYLRPPPRPPQLPSALQQLASSLPEPPKMPLPPFPLPRPAQDLLNSIQRLTSSYSSTPPQTPGPSLTVSLLSTENEAIAQTMSKPQTNQAEAFALERTWDGADPPALLGSIGRLRCEVITSIPLRDVCGGCEADTPDGGLGAHPGSELFICRVLAVDEAGQKDGSKPMLYWRQNYIGVGDDSDK